MDIPIESPQVVGLVEIALILTYCRSKNASFSETSSAILFPSLLLAAYNC